MKSTAETCIKNGNLSEALENLQAQVREKPADAPLRVFLFQLLVAIGDWSRALTQLDVIEELDSESQLMAQTYRQLLSCEKYRESVFEGTHQPLVMGEATVSIAKLVQALSLAAIGDGDSARVLVNDAYDGIETRSGLIDGVQFEWLADADMRLGPVMEAIINGKYYWIELDRIKQMHISEPEDLRDLVWIPVEFTWTNGGESVGFLPSRYPGERTLSEDATALARKTSWTDLGSDYFVGAGQKVFSTEQDDYSLLQVRHIQFNTDERTEISG